MLEDSECFIIHLKETKQKQNRETTITEKKNKSSGNCVFCITSVCRVFINICMDTIYSVRFVCEFTFHSVLHKGNKLYVILPNKSIFNFLKNRDEHHLVNMYI